MNEILLYGLSAITAILVVFMIISLLSIPLIGILEATNFDKEVERKLKAKEKLNKKEKMYCNLTVFTDCFGEFATFFGIVLMSIAAYPVEVITSLNKIEQTDLLPKYNQVEIKDYEIYEHDSSIIVFKLGLGKEDYIIKTNRLPERALASIRENETIKLFIEKKEGMLNPDGIFYESYKYNINEDLKARVAIFGQEMEKLPEGIYIEKR